MKSLSSGLLRHTQKFKKGKQTKKKNKTKHNIEEISHTYIGHSSDMPVSAYAYVS